MKLSLFLIICCSFFATSPLVYAGNKKGGSNSNSANAAKKKADDAAKKAAQEAKKASDDAWVQKHFTALKANLPNIKVSDLEGISKTDLRQLYLRAFESQGMHMMEARQKADSIDLN